MVKIQKSSAEQSLDRLFNQYEQQINEKGSIEIEEAMILLRSIAVSLNSLFHQQSQQRLSFQRQLLEENNKLAIDARQTHPVSASLKTAAIALPILGAILPIQCGEGNPIKNISNLLSTTGRGFEMGNSFYDTRRDVKSTQASHGETQIKSAMQLMESELSSQRQQLSQAKQMAKETDDAYHNAKSRVLS